MEFDPTVNWQSILTVLALASSWIIPLLMNYLRRRRRQNVVRDGVSLYLDVLQTKLCIAGSSFFQPGARLPTGKGSFESVNKHNFDTIERLFASEDLNARDRRQLLELIRYYKLSPTMKSREEFLSLLEQVARDGLRRRFPIETDIEKTVIELREQWRKKRLAK